MKNTLRNVVLVSGFSALAAFASAQALQGAANAAGNVRAPVLPPPPPVTATANTAAQNATAAAASVRAPVLPPSAAATASVATQGAAAASVRTPVTPPVSPNASGVAQAHVAAGVPAGTPNINAQTHASAQGQAAGAAFANALSNEATVSLDATSTVQSIRAATFAERRRVNTDVQTRLDASAEHIANLQARAEASGEKSRAAFAKALVEVRQREQELRATLKDSVKTTKESSWGEIQSALAQNYGAYAQAVIQAEAAVQSDPPATPQF